MKSPISKIIFIIGVLSAVGMIYLLLTEETNKLFYILMLISLSSWSLNQYISRKGKKDEGPEDAD
ncbi:MAG: hypothetical protein WC780_02635 [Lentimicrobiaceae bacterium]|jgi:hypothetical protein